MAGVTDFVLSKLWPDHFYVVFPRGSNHWLCTSRLCGSSTIMDSKVLFHRITDNTELQLAKIYSPRNVCPMWTSLQVEVVPVQQQEGVNDCCLFAIAFAMEECLGRKSESAEFDQLLMRAHMIKCLKEEYFTPFLKVTHGTTVLPRPTHIVKHNYIIM